MPPRAKQGRREDREGEAAGLGPRWQTILLAGTGARMDTQGGLAVHCSGHQEEGRKKAEFSQPHLQ